MVEKLLRDRGISFSREIVGALLVFSFFQPDLLAQVQRNKAYIASGGQITILKNFDFGVYGSLSAIIHADRELPYGVVNFAAGIYSVNGGDDSHIDGYVRKYGTSQLIFPVGHKGFYGPFSASADGTAGAYFRQNPSDASYRASSKDLTIGFISPVEFWDIDGKNKTRISLTWDIDSKIDTLVEKLDDLIIVGFQKGKWVPIQSKVDPTSVLKGSSNFEAGSITSIEAFAPNDFEAYTLAGKVEPPLVITDPLTDLTVYPNPAIETLKLAQQKSAKTIRRETLKITDVLGRDHTESVYWVRDDLHIGNLVRGMYIITFLDQSGKALHSKFLVAR